MLDALGETLRHAARVVDGVRECHLTLATPCPAFDVRRLVNHMVGGNLAFAASARGEPVAMEVYTDDHIGDDAPAAYRRSARVAVEAWSLPGVLERILPFGNMPGHQVAGLYLTEELVHSWDLAVATGQDPTLPPHLCEVALQAALPLPAGQLRHPAVFGPEVPVPCDAPPQHRLLGFVGRDPHGFTP